MEHTVISDDVRVLKRSGKWGKQKEDLIKGLTIFVPAPDATRARNALAQAFRADSEWALHRTTHTLDNQDGLAFWLTQR